MSKLLAAVLVLAIGCHEPANTCGNTTGLLVPGGSIDDDFAIRAELAREVTNAIADACRDDHWSQEAIDCMVLARGTGHDITTVLEDCQRAIGPAYARLDKTLSDLSIDAMKKQLDLARARRAAVLGMVSP